VNFELYGVDPQDVLDGDLPSELNSTGIRLDFGLGENINKVMNLFLGQLGKPYGRQDWPGACYPPRNPNWFRDDLLVFWGYEWVDVDVGYGYLSQVEKIGSEFLEVLPTKDDLMPGDLVFYPSTTNYRVAVYLDAEEIIAVPKNSIVHSRPLISPGYVPMAACRPFHPLKVTYERSSKV